MSAVESKDPRTWSFGRRLRELRTMGGMTQTDLAQRAGLARGYVSELENDKHPRPSADTISSLSDALGREYLDLTNAEYFAWVVERRRAVELGLSPPPAPGEPPAYSTGGPKPAGSSGTRTPGDDHVREVVRDELRRQIAELEGRGGDQRLPDYFALLGPANGAPADPPFAGTIGADREDGSEETVGELGEVEWRHLAATGGIYRFRVGAHSTCMAPLIAPGDEVWIDTRRKTPPDGRIVAVFIQGSEHPQLKRRYKRASTILLVDGSREGMAYTVREVEVIGEVVRVIKSELPDEPLPQHLEPGFHEKAS